MNNNVRSVGIKGGGYWLPEKIVRNSDFGHIPDISEEWIEVRTGIKERRILPADESTSDLAVKAAKKALENAGLTENEIDCIIVATSTPDMYFPSTACIVQSKLKARHAAAFDLFAACASFIYGLQVGSNMIATGFFQNVMIIGAEALTRFVNIEDKNTAVLFGDGAGCVILSPINDERKIISCFVGADGQGSSILSVPAGGARLPTSEDTVAKKLHYINMDGTETYKACIRTMTTSIVDLLNKHELKIEDIDYLITHQANLRIIEGVTKRLGMPKEKIHINVTYLGNTAAASIPIGLCECMEQNKFKPGDKILLATFGAGFTWGSCIIKW